MSHLGVSIGDRVIGGNRQVGIVRQLMDEHPDGHQLHGVLVESVNERGNGRGTAIVFMEGDFQRMEDQPMRSEDEIYLIGVGDGGGSACYTGEALPPPGGWIAEAVRQIGIAGIRRDILGTPDGGNWTEEEVRGLAVYAKGAQAGANEIVNGL